VGYIEASIVQWVFPSWENFVEVLMKLLSIMIRWLTMQEPKFMLDAGNMKL
jgi:hypothetical protein